MIFSNTLQTQKYFGNQIIPIIWKHPQNKVTRSTTFLYMESEFIRFFDLVKGSRVYPIAIRQLFTIIAYENNKRLEKVLS